MTVWDLLGIMVLWVGLVAAGLWAMWKFTFEPWAREIDEWTAERDRYWKKREQNKR